MKTKELITLSTGENIDSLINLDLRGFGIPKILYSAARKTQKYPLCMHSAESLVKSVKKGDSVFILTGFMFPPHNKGELDGLVGSVMIARALDIALGVKPIIICEEELIDTVKNVATTAGLNVYTDIKAAQKMPHSLAIIPFTKEERYVDQEIENIFSTVLPSAIISVEKPGKNKAGVYHMGNGTDVSHLAAKVDKLFIEAVKRNILSIAIGDLGNELGLGAIKDMVNTYIPFGKECQCPCGQGLTAEVKADKLITAATSDWGCYGLVASLSYLSNNLEVMHTGKLEERVLISAAESGVIDGSGWAIPAIDGIGIDYNILLVEALYNSIYYPLKNKEKFSEMSEEVIRLGFFNNIEESDEIGND